MTAPARPRFRSPTCRVSDGPRRHPCSPFHADLVEGYRIWRDVELEIADLECIGYQTELDEYWLTHERPTFGRYLRDMRQHEH